MGFLQASYKDDKNRILSKINTAIVKLEREDDFKNSRSLKNQTHRRQMFGITTEQQMQGSDWLAGGCGGAALDQSEDCFPLVGHRLLENVRNCW